MTTKANLRGSFGRLIDTLSHRFDPLQPQEVVEIWLGLMGHASSVARERTKWRDLPDERADYGPTLKTLDGSAGGLVSAFGEPSAKVISALSQCEGALEKLEGVLG